MNQIFIFDTLLILVYLMMLIQSNLTLKFIKHAKEIKNQNFSISSQTFFTHPSKFEEQFTLEYDAQLYYYTIPKKGRYVSEIFILYFYGIISVFLAFFYGFLRVFSVFFHVFYEGFMRV
jgi:hypothetical protein